MTEEEYLKLTSAVYKIIEFFPEEEPLKNKIKEKTSEILAYLILLSIPSTKNPGLIQKEKVSSQILKDIEILKNYLKLGKSQGWIESLNFFILAKEYDKIREEIQAPGVEEVSISSLKSSEESLKSEVMPVSERQKKILKILEEQKRAQVSDFKKIFISVSKRTLRRDLEDLLKKKRVIRAGEWNQVFYKLS